MSLWKVSVNWIGGEKAYQVYRQKDPAEVDHAGNREYSDRIFDDEDLAQAYADTLNEEEFGG